MSAERIATPAGRRVHPWLCGAVYGVFLYVVMNYVVVPLSRAGPGSKDVLWITLSVLAHMLLVGIPCAVFVRRAVMASPTTSS